MTEFPTSEVHFVKVLFVNTVFAVHSCKMYTEILNKHISIFVFSNCILQFSYNYSTETTLYT